MRDRLEPHYLGASFTAFFFFRPTNMSLRSAIDPTDRRVCRVALSDAGHKQVELNRSRRTAWLADRLSLLSPDEQKRLVAALDVLEQLTTAPRPVDAP